MQLIILPSIAPWRIVFLLLIAFHYFFHTTQSQTAMHAEACNLQDPIRVSGGKAPQRKDSDALSRFQRPENLLRWPQQQVLGLRTDGSFGKVF